MERYFEINEGGHNIRCKLYYNNIRDIKKVVIFCHGFAGHKDNGAANKFADRVLAKYKDIAVLIFNWPCHGDDVKKTLKLDDCMEYLSTVVQYAKTQYSTEEVYCYATSFGGYLTLKYIAGEGNPFKKIALRCPAVNMFSVLTNTIMNLEEFEEIQKGKSVPVGFDRKIDVSPQFLNELHSEDIQLKDYRNYADDILILHGTEDEVVPFEAVNSFADANLIEFISVEGADHRFQNPVCMELATKRVIEFFGF